MTDIAENNALLEEWYYLKNDFYVLRETVRRQLEIGERVLKVVLPGDPLYAEPQNTRVNAV